MHTQKVVLISGATGSVGSMTLAHLVQNTDVEVVALVRADSDAHAQARINAVLDRTVIGGARRAGTRVRALAADLTQPRCGLSSDDLTLLADTVTRVIHLAGNVSFAASLEEAVAVNVGGTKAMLDLADELPSLDRFVHISTAYVRGDDHGDWRTPYEESKWTAEQLVRSRRFATTILRPSIVGGAAADGFTTDTTSVFYLPLHLLGTGMPLVRAESGGLLDIVPVDWLAAAIAAVGFAGEAVGGTYDLAMGDRASSVGEFIALAAEHGGIDEPEVVSPDGATLAELVAKERITSRQAADLRFIERVYGGYLEVTTTFDPGPANAILADHGISAAPRFSEYCKAVFDFAKADEGGKRKPQHTREQWQQSLA